MDDEVNTRLSESIQNSIVYNNSDFSTTETYFKYLYLLARDHMNNSELNKIIYDTIEYRFVVDRLFTTNITRLNLKEILYLISLLSKGDIMKAVRGIMRRLNHTIIMDRMSREKNIEFVKKIITDLITNTEYMDYLIVTRNYYNTAMEDYLNILLPSYDEIKIILDKYDNNNNNNVSLNVLKEYINKIILNQV